MIKFQKIETCILLQWKMGRQRQIKLSQWPNDQKEVKKLTFIFKDKGDYQHDLCA